MASDWDEPTPASAAKPDLRWTEAEESPAAPDPYEADAYPPPEGAAPDNLGSEGARPRLNPSILFTFAFLALIFFGNRILSGELLIAAFILLVAAQWLVRRYERGRE